MKILLSDVELRILRLQGKGSDEDYLQYRKFDYRLNRWTPWRHVPIVRKSK
jgi:hypothetical protein